MRKTITHYRCDFCHTEVSMEMEQKNSVPYPFKNGWTRIANVTIIVPDGSNPIGQEVSVADIDVCSKKCFLDILEKGIKKEEMTQREVKELMDIPENDLDLGVNEDLYEKEIKEQEKALNPSKPKPMKHPEPTDDQYFSEPAPMPEPKAVPEEKPKFEEVSKPKPIVEEKPKKKGMFSFGKKK